MTSDSSMSSSMMAGARVRASSCSSASHARLCAAATVSSAAGGTSTSLMICRNLPVQLTPTCLLKSCLAWEQVHASIVHTSLR